MKWNYRCPICHEWRSIDWEKRGLKYNCHKDNSKSYTPPTPAEQHDAYVDTHNWPDEMEQAVIDTKRDHCTVPSCSKKYEVLDHRIPYSKGGKTSVQNLFPMCTKHNESKGDKNYSVWLMEQIDQA